jgi:hypothetical protein
VTILIDVAISLDRNVIKKEAEKILKYKDLTTEIQRMWNVKPKVIPGNWNHLKIIQKVSERHTGKAQNKGTTENTHIGHCTHISGRNNVRYKTFNMGNITSTINCNCSIGAALIQYTIGTCFVSGM